MRGIPLVIFHLISPVICHQMNQLPHQSSDKEEVIDFDDGEIFTMLTHRWREATLSSLALEING